MEQIMFGPDLERFTGKLRELMEHALEGKMDNIDHIFSHLHPDVCFENTRYVDYALSLVEDPEGIVRIEHYLFNGILIQRNYASLYFNRRGNMEIVRKAFHKGLIDELQAFAR